MSSINKLILKGLLKYFFFQFILILLNIKVLIETFINIIFLDFLSFNKIFIFGHNIYIIFNTVYHRHLYMYLNIFLNSMIENFCYIFRFMLTFNNFNIFRL